MALDGLLGRGRSSALVKYESKNDRDLVDEEIDVVILRLLGLEDVFDIDYGTYKTLLRERLAAARMGGNNIPSEEDQLIVEEFKRVKSKTGRFKVKKKNITAKSFTSPVKSTAITLRKKPLLLQPTSQIKKDDVVDKIKDDTSNPFLVINKKLDSILSTLSQQLNLQKKASDEDRKKKENLKRQKREESLEKGFKIIKDIVQKALQPFQNIFDRIWKFITFVLLGRAFLGLMRWLENPQNQKRLDTIVRFLKDWWPSLAFAAGLFLTPFGKFVRTTLSLLRGFVPQILKIIPQLTRILATNPIALPIIASTVGAVAKIQESERMRPLTEKSQKEIDKTLKSKDAPWYEKLGASFAGQSLNAPGGPVNPIGMQAPGAWASGGIISKFSSGNYFSGSVGKNSGQNVSGFGQDTQAFPVEGGGSAVLQPGETVLQVGARERMIQETGHDPLAFNVGPNANKPKVYNKNLFGNSSGGIIGFNNGGIVGSEGNKPIRWSIYEAQQRLLERQDQKNVNINNNYNPWWQRINPFVNKTPWQLRLPGHNLEERNYNMPGYNLPDWKKLDKFRTEKQNPFGTRSRGRGPSYRYAPNYIRPGIDKPMTLQGGGEVERLERTYKQGQRSGANSEALKAIGDEAFLLRHFGAGGVWRNFKGSGATDYRGNIIPQKQDGGLMSGLDNIGRSVFENVGGTIGRSRGRETGIPGGGFLGEKLGKREGRKRYEQILSPFRKNSGGLIKENSGMNIHGATADRQLTALQPGEYVLPVDTVNRLGTSLIDKMVALTDSNSSAAKLGKRSVNRTIPGPLSRSRGSNTMTLPPIMSGSGGGSVGSGNAQMNNSHVALFDITPSTSIEQRTINAKMYGLNN